jgi:hypothetical protein
MTVKELESILCTIKNKDLKVCMSGYYTQDVNGYFYDKKEDSDVLFLTANNVQPRIV